MSMSLTLSAVHSADKAQTAKQIKQILKKAPKNNYQKEFEQIISMGPEVVPALVEIFLDSRVDGNERWIAGMALGRFPGLDSRRALEKGLKDVFPNIRMASATAIGNKRDRVSAPALRRALTDQAMAVRSAVVVAIGRIKDRDAVADLTAELMAPRNYNQGKSFWVREDIIDALGNIADESALPVLKKTLLEKEPNIQQKSCQALSKIDSVGAKKVKHPTGPKCTEAWLKWLDKANIKS